MAFYGSASANLSPILFKGNLFSEGVNIIMHSDVSLSMSAPVSAASTNYTMAPRSGATGNFSNFAANYRNSPFYDGIFPTFLQKRLVQNKIGDSTRSPNLFSYFDSTVRAIGSPLETTKQAIVENTETYTFLDSVILARDTGSIPSSLTPNFGNLKDPKTFYDFWRTRYVDNFYASGTISFSDSYPFNVAAFNNRLNDVNTTPSSISAYTSTQNTQNAKLSYYSEDVHGNIVSLFYSGTPTSSSIKTGGNEITDGDVSKATIGGDLYKIPRRRLPTYLITASNEQENAAADIISTTYQTKTNVGYSTDKYKYTASGVYARRYRGCVASVVWNSGCTRAGGNTYGIEQYRDWFLNYAVPLPFNVYGATNSSLEDAPGINWFNNANTITSQTSITGDSKFAIDIGGTPYVSYYTLSGSNYNYDTNYPTNTANDDVTFTQAFVPQHLQTNTTYDVNFNPNIISYSQYTAPDPASIVKRSITDDNRYGGFWGPLTSLDRVRSDIQNYTMMIIGYFRPPTDGIYRIKILSAGCCAIWISSDKRLAPGGGGGAQWQEVSPLTDNDVYTGWNSPANATITSPTATGDRFLAANPGGSNSTATWNDVYGDSSGIVSDYLEMTAGRYYPIRIILSNPGEVYGTASALSGAESNNFSLPTSTTTTPPSQLSCNTSSISAINNPSFLRLLFSNPKVKPASTSTALPTLTETEWNLEKINGAPVLFGGLDVWAYGSPFFPLPQTTISKNIKDEINQRNLRVISLSSYESNDGYDGVFFLRKPNDPTQLYRYINLTPDGYTKFDTNTVSPFSEWRFGRYFKPTTYSVTSSNIQYITGSGNSLNLNISKLNDRYLTVPIDGGVGFKTGDRIKVTNNQIGGSNSLNDLLLSVSQVQSQSYSNLTGSLEGSVRTDFPSFFVYKNKDQDNFADYQIDINTNDAGSGYAVNDRLVISGSILDGQDPQNNINIKVTSVGAGGTITGVSPIDGAPNYGSPTNRIGYGVTLTDFNPIPYSSINFDVKDCSIGYRYQVVSGAAYTTASITGISYTTLPVTGAAHSSFNITGIAYTTGSIVSIGYSTANITGIAYTTRDIVSIGYSAASITGIAYTNANIVSIGYSSSSVTAIGYTSPQVVSIGYTAFEVLDITYPNAFTITSIVDTPGNPANTNVRVSISGSPDLTTAVDVGGSVVISGTGDSRIDGQRAIASIVDATTLEIVPQIPITSLTLNPTGAKLIIDNDNVFGDPVGYGSTALLRTKINHTFNTGDSIVIRGVKKPQYTNWNSTFVVQAVETSTSVWLENTGTVGLFTATSLGQEVGAGLTVSYDQAELQLEIARPAPYQFQVGMGITIFGITGNASIHNNGYVIQSILESDVDGPYKFDLLQNQTPSQLALPGTNGTIGIHTISGIATVTSTSKFGLPGDSIDLKIENSTTQFFNKVFTGATILDSNRILLGPDSYRSENTPNPGEYVRLDANVSASTVSGRIGSPLQVTYSNLTPGYTFNVNDKIDVYNTSPTISYNTVGNSYFYSINSISGSTLTLNKTAGVNTSFALTATSGKIGVRDIPPIITVNTVSGLTTNFGYIGQGGIPIAIKNSLKANLNSDLITWSGRVIASDKILVESAGSYNPLDRIPADNYDAVGIGGTVGLIGSRLRVRTSQNHGFIVGNSIRLQNIVDQNSNPAYNGTYTINGIINPTTFELTASTVSNNFGIVGTSGTVGLIANAVVTTSTDHPFVTGNLIKIQSTGNSDFDNNTFEILNIISPTSFTLKDTSTGAFTDDFTTSGASTGIAGLINYPATVTYTSPYIFRTGQKVFIGNTTKTYGNSNGRYTITYVNDTTFTLDVNATSSTDISNKDTLGLIGLMDAKPVVTYETNHRVINTDLKLRTGDSIKIQSTGDSKFDDKVFSVDLILNADPNGTISISGNNIENSFSSPSAPNFTSYSGTTAIGGLIGSRLRVRSVNHGLPLTGGTVRIQGTQSALYDGNSTYAYLTSNIIDLNGAFPYTSNSTTDFTKIEGTTSSARLGPHGYPAIATFSDVLPNAFTTGSQVKIEGKTVGFNTNATYTIVRYDDTRVAIAESVIGNIYPLNINFVENDVSLYAGLRNSPPKIFVSNTADFGGIGTVCTVNISGMNAFFNGTQDARVTSSSTLDLIQRTNPDDQNPKIPYNLSGIDVDGIVGLANSLRVVTVPTGHNLRSFGNLNIGASIYLRSPNQSSYDGTFTIREILDSNRFTIDQIPTTANPSNYTLVENSGYYVGINSGVRVTTSIAHILSGTPGNINNDSFNLIDNQSIFANGAYQVRTVYSPTIFSVENTFPSTNLNTFDFKKNSTSGTITPLRPSARTDAILQINRVLNTTNGNGEYKLAGTTQASDFINRSGNQYRSGQRFLIKGGLLGGNNSTHDLVVTVGSVNAISGAIDYNSTDVNLNVLPTLTGSADPTLDYSINGVLIPKESQDFTGGGSGATFNIVRSGLRTPTGIPTYTSVSIVNGGNNYIQNNVIKIPGINLGGVTGINDLYVRVLSVNSGSVNGIAITGIASDSYPVTGFSTVYFDGSNPISRPYGLEQNWDHSTSSSPPTQGAYLEQKQDILTLAAENYGGVVKIDKVYNIGAPEKIANISSCFFYGWMWWSQSDTDSEIIFDRSNSGICTIFLDGDAVTDEIDGVPFRTMTPGDRVFIYDSTSEYLDYPSVGYAHTVINVFTNTNFRDYIVVNTNNKSYKSTDDKGLGNDSPQFLKIIKTSSPLTIAASNHGLSDGDRVTLYLTQDVNGLPYETSTGLGYTTYTVRNPSNSANTFVLDGSSGRIVAETTLNNQTKPLIDYWYDYRRGTLYSIDGIRQDTVGTNTDNGNLSPYAYIIVAKGGRAYVVGAGATPVDNRIGLTKAIGDFITETSLN